MTLYISTFHYTDRDHVFFHHFRRSQQVLEGSWRVQRRVEALFMGKPWRVAEGMEGCMEKRAESVEGCGGL